MRAMQECPAPAIDEVPDDVRRTVSLHRNPILLEIVGVASDDQSVIVRIGDPIDVC